MGSSGVADWVPVCAVEASGMEETGSGGAWVTAVSSGAGAASGGAEITAFPSRASGLASVRSASCPG